MKKAIGEVSRFTGLLSLVMITACSPPAQSVQSAIPVPQRTLSDTVAVRAALAKRFAVADSEVGEAVAFRGDTAWATVRADSISVHIARVEYRRGAWVYVRIDGTGIR